VTDVEDFFRTYGEAFAEGDVKAVVARYAFPAHVTSDTPEGVRLVAFGSPEQLEPPLANLCAMYRKVGCKKIRVLELDAQVLSAKLRRAVVRWGLVGLAELPLYDFVTSYVIARFDADWRVVSAVSHDEMARYRQFIGR
jgi:hypothetical protein